MLHGYEEAFTGIVIKQAFDMRASEVCEVVGQIWFQGYASVHVTRNISWCCDRIGRVRYLLVKIALIRLCLVNGHCAVRAYARRGAWLQPQLLVAL